MQLVRSHSRNLFKSTVKSQSDKTNKDEDESYTEFAISTGPFAGSVIEAINNDNNDNENGKGHVENDHQRFLLLFVGLSFAICLTKKDQRTVGTLGMATEWKIQ